MQSVEDERKQVESHRAEVSGVHTAIIIYTHTEWNPLIETPLGPPYFGVKSTHKQTWYIYDSNCS